MTIKSVSVVRRKGIATQVAILSSWRGVAIHYKLSVPLEGYSDVIVSAIDHADAVFRTFETYIFPCDEHGKVISYCELPGSVRDTNDHTQVLADINYSIQTN